MLAGSGAPEGILDEYLLLVCLSLGLRCSPGQSSWSEQLLVQSLVNPSIGLGASVSHSDVGSLTLLKKPCPSEVVAW